MRTKGLYMLVFLIVLSPFLPGQLPFPTTVLVLDSLCMPSLSLPRLPTDQKSCSNRPEKFPFFSSSVRAQSGK